RSSLLFFVGVSLPLPSAPLFPYTTLFRSLNAFTGLSVAATGYVFENLLLLVAGTLVGAAGTLLTVLMARAMGRSLLSTLFAALRGGSTLGSTAVSERPVRSAGPESVAIKLGYAGRVIIVPGYGLRSEEHTS